MSFVHRLLSGQRKRRRDTESKPLAKGSTLYVLAETLPLVKKTAIVIGINKVSRMLEQNSLRIVMLFDSDHEALKHVRALSQRLDNVPIVSFTAEDSKHIARALDIKCVTAIGLLRSGLSLASSSENKTGTSNQAANVNQTALDDAVAILFQHLDRQNEAIKKKKTKKTTSSLYHKEQPDQGSKGS